MSEESKGITEEIALLDDQMVEIIASISLLEDEIEEVEAQVETTKQEYENCQYSNYERIHNTRFFEKHLHFILFLSLFYPCAVCNTLWL